MWLLLALPKKKKSRPRGQWLFLYSVQKKKQEFDTFRWQLGQTVSCDHNPQNRHRLELEVRSEPFQTHPPQGVSIILSTLLNSPSHTHTHSKHHTLLFFPTHCGYLSLLTSLVTTPRPPSHAALGSHCVFITIKESPACLTIRPHYSALRFLTLVTLWSVIWPALMQDFLAGVSPQVGGEVGRQTHTDYIRVDVHGS